MIHTRPLLENKMAEIEQLVAMETKMRRKSQAFFQKLCDSCKTSSKGADQRTMMNKVSRQIAEMSAKIAKLDAIRKHLEVSW